MLYQEVTSDMSIIAKSLNGKMLINRQFGPVEFAIVGKSAKQRQYGTESCRCWVFYVSLKIKFKIKVAQVGHDTRGGVMPVFWLNYQNSMGVVVC